LAPALLELGRAFVGLAARDALTRARRVLQGSTAAAQMVGLGWHVGVMGAEV